MLKRCRNCRFYYDDAKTGNEKVCPNCGKNSPKEQSAAPKPKPATEETGTSPSSAEEITLYPSDETEQEETGTGT